MEQLSQVYLQFTLGQHAGAREERQKQMASALKGIESWVTLGEQRPTIKNVERCYRWLRELEGHAIHDPEFLRVARRLYEVGTLLPAMNWALATSTNRRLLALWDFYNTCEAERVGPRHTYQAVPPFDFLMELHEGFTTDERLLKGLDHAKWEIQQVAAANGLPLIGYSARLNYDLWDRSFQWLRKTRFKDIVYLRPVRVGHAAHICADAKKALRVVLPVRIQDPDDLRILNEFLEKEAGSEYRITASFSLKDYPVIVDIQRLNQPPMKLWTITIR